MELTLFCKVGDRSEKLRKRLCRMYVPVKLDFLCILYPYASCLRNTLSARNLVDFFVLDEHCFDQNSHKMHKKR